ncbi:glycosyltransferase family 22 protein [Backusella circina FSU 941]|nr:glycosyltransferase family 22 protein [Backusella circina FSU 941]
MAGQVFHLRVFTPWEYQEAAARSIVSPLLTTGIPFYLLKLWLGDQTPTSYALLTTQRMSAFVWSLLIDFCVYRLCKKMGTKPALPMILVATSQVTLAYYTRPFSNSFESIILCSSLLLYVELAKEPWNPKFAFGLGALFSLGVFTRITFPLYALPIGLGFLYQAWKKNGNIVGFVNAVMPLAAGMVLTAGFCAMLDSIYYDRLSVTVSGQPFNDIGHAISTLLDPTAMTNIRVQGHMVLTPLNNLMYNLNADNLAKHGIHARYTHFAVNLPLLYGPLVINALLYIPHLYAIVKDDVHSDFICVLLGIFITGLTGLSIMPHQEARFLCPLLVPLVLIYTWKKPRLATSFWISWVLFNIATTYIFAVVHQGGIIPVLSLLQHQKSVIHNCHALDTSDLSCFLGGNESQQQYNLTTNIIFYKTYMPPRHLLVINDEHNVNVMDFSSRYDDMLATLNQQQGVVLRRHEHNEISFAKTHLPNHYTRTFFVVPSYVPLPKLDNKRYMLMGSYSPHVSFDDMDSIMQSDKSPESQTYLNAFLILVDSQN